MTVMWKGIQEHIINLHNCVKVKLIFDDEVS